MPQTVNENLSAIICVYVVSVVFVKKLAFFLNVCLSVSLMFLFGVVCLYPMVFYTLIISVELVTIGSQHWWTSASLAACQIVITTSPVGDGVLFSGNFFLSFFVSLSATLRENGWTDLHEILKEGVEWPWDDLIQFWVGGSKVNLFVITSHSSEDWR